MTKRERAVGAGVLFDVGYGLLDETARCQAAIEWLSGYLREHGVETSAAELASLYRQACVAPIPDIGGLMVQTALAAGASAELAARQRRHVPWDAVPMTPIDGAIDCLGALRSAGIRVGVLANQPASAEEDLRSSGVLALLDGVWLSDVVGLYKPDPSLFQLALDAWQLDASHVAYVGDCPDNDVAPARRLGMHAVRVLFGPHADQPAHGSEERADFEARSLAEVADHLLGWAATF